MAFSVETYAVLLKKIKAFLTGIGDVKAIPPNKLEFTNVNNNNKFVVTLPMNMTQEQLDWLIDMSSKLKENTTTGKLEFNGEPIESLITENIKSTVNCGAVSIGDVINNGTNLTEFAKKLLIKDVAPLVTITSDIDETKVYEKGVTITPTLTVVAKKLNTGDNDITKVTLQATPSDTNYDYVDNTPNVNTNTYIKNTSISSTTSYKASAINTKNLTGSKTLKFTFVNPIYIGSVAETLNETSVTESDIKAGCTKILADITLTNPSYTETMTVNMKKIIIAYDKSIGTLKEIIDVANNMNTISAFNKFDVNVTTIDNSIVTYECFIGKVRSNVKNMDMKFVWN